MNANMAEDAIRTAVRDFCEAAIEKGAYAFPAKRDRKLHARMAAAVKQLRTLGATGAIALNELMSHESPYVRSWIATELLVRGDTSAKPVLKALAAEPGLLGMSAMVVLQEYDAGRLRSPFTDAA